MPGVHLKEIESNLLAIDDLGNLILSTKGRLVGQIAAGNIPQFGGKGIPTSFTITPAQGGSSNICDVTYQAVDIAGNAVSGIFVFDAWLSDASSGAGLTATTASGGIDVKASSGAVMGVTTTAKAVRAQTKSDGTFILSITDTAKTLFYPCASLLGRTTVGAKLVAGNYK